MKKPVGEEVVRGTNLFAVSESYKELSRIEFQKLSSCKDFFSEFIYIDI